MFGMGRGSERDALSGECFAMEGSRRDMRQVKMKVLVLCCSATLSGCIYQHILDGMDAQRQSDNKVECSDACCVLKNLLFGFLFT